VWAAKRIPEWKWEFFHHYGHQHSFGRTYLMALLGTDSIWDRATGLPKGTLEQYPNAILLVSVPTTDVEIVEPRDITEEELLARVVEGQEVLFITAGRRCGVVRIIEGRLRFEPSR
jgi:hypothetical protein